MERMLTVMRQAWAPATRLHRLQEELLCRSGPQGAVGKVLHRTAVPSEGAGREVQILQNPLRPPHRSERVWSTGTAGGASPGAGQAGELVSKGDRISFWIRRLWKWIVVMVAQH